jgi:hypothetical protein
MPTQFSFALETLKRDIKMLEHTRDSLFRKIAEKISRNHSIDWENWDDEETDSLENDAITNICFFEELLDDYDEELTIDEYNYIVSRIMEGYILISVLERKRTIEKLIKTSVE